jgi:hypothetical protein
MTRKIVRRTFTILDGKKSDRVDYAVYPLSPNGTSVFDIDMNKAYLFCDQELNYSPCTITGNDRLGGDFAYKQEILEVNLTIKEK